MKRGVVVGHPHESWLAPPNSPTLSDAEAPLTETMNPRTTLVPALPVLVLTSMPLATHAQEAASAPPVTSEQEREREARALFQLAHAHYDTGRYAEAATELERVYGLSPRAEILLDIHLAYRELGNAEGSADALRRYLAAARGIAPEDRLVLERRLSALEATLAQQRESAIAAGATPVTAIAEPPSEPTTASTPTAEGSPIAARDSEDATPWGAVAGYSLGGIGVLMTAIAGPLALAERDRLTCAPTCTDSQVSPARTLGIAADVGLGVAAAGAIAGTVFLLTQPGPRRPTDVALVVAPLPQGLAVSVGGVL